MTYVFHIIFRLNRANLDKGTKALGSGATTSSGGLSQPQPHVGFLLPEHPWSLALSYKMLSDII